MPRENAHRLPNENTHTVLMDRRRRIGRSRMAGYSHRRDRDGDYAASLLTKAVLSLGGGEGSTSTMKAKLSAQRPFGWFGCKPDVATGAGRRDRRRGPEARSGRRTCHLGLSARP